MIVFCVFMFVCVSSRWVCCVGVVLSVVVRRVCLCLCLCCWVDVLLFVFVTL